MRYTTILLLLTFSLFAFTSFLDHLTPNKSSVDENTYYFYLPSTDSSMAKYEKFMAKNLSKANDYKFVNVKPLETVDLLNILASIERERRLDANLLVSNTLYFFKTTKNAVLDQMNSLNVTLTIPSEHEFFKSFIVWASKVKNYRTTFDKLTPYDSLIKKYAREYSLDWKLVAAQMFAESSYNPKSTSFAGAKGLMQLTPIAMKETGLKEAYRVEDNILHGIKYLKSRYEILESIPSHSRLQFSLASYNAGIGHLRDAQRLATINGLNPKQWENSVDKMFLDLPYANDVYEEIEHGFCRGSETVNYVDKIIKRYKAYKSFVFED